MTVQRMDNVGVVVEDLEPTIEFFRELGLELEGRAMVEGHRFGARFWGQVRGFSVPLKVLQGDGAASGETRRIAGKPH